MAVKKKESSALTLAQLKAKLLETRLNIRARQEKNTNAHKPIKKQIAQELTKRK